MRYWLLHGGKKMGPLEPGELERVPGFGPGSMVCEHRQQRTEPWFWRPAKELLGLAEVLGRLERRGPPSPPPSPPEKGEDFDEMGDNLERTAEALSRTREELRGRDEELVSMKAALDVRRRHMEELNSKLIEIQARLKAASSLGGAIGDERPQVVGELKERMRILREELRCLAKAAADAEPSAELKAHFDPSPAEPESAPKLSAAGPVVPSREEPEPVRKPRRKTPGLLVGAGLIAAPAALLVCLSYFDRGKPPPPEAGPAAKAHSRAAASPEDPKPFVAPPIEPGKPRVVATGSPPEEPAPPAAKITRGRRAAEKPPRVARRIQPVKKPDTAEPRRAASKPSAGKPRPKIIRRIISKAPAKKPRPKPARRIAAKKPDTAEPRRAASKPSAGKPRPKIIRRIISKAPAKQPRPKPVWRIAAKKPEPIRECRPEPAGSRTAEGEKAVEFAQFFPGTKKTLIECPLDFDSLEDRSTMGTVRPRQIWSKLLCEPLRIARASMKALALEREIPEKDVAKRIRGVVDAQGGLDTAYPLEWSVARAGPGRYSVRVCRQDKLSPLLAAEFTKGAPQGKQAPPQLLEFEVDLSLRTLRPMTDAAWMLVDVESFRKWMGDGASLAKGRGLRGAAPAYRAGEDGYAEVFTSAGQAGM